jgi:hypothetical protein
MIKKAFLFFVLISFISLNFVSAELNQREIDKINSDYVNLPDDQDYNFFYRYYLAYKQSNLFTDGESFWKNFFGTTKFVFNDFVGVDDYQSFRGGEFGFILGFFCALFMWIFCKIRDGYYWLVKLSGGKKEKAYDPEKDLDERKTSEWIGFLSGSVWKIFVFAIGLGILMYIPILNRIIQIITLQMFDMGVFAHALVLAIEIGVLPQVIEDYRRATINTKMLKIRMEMQKGMKKNQISGQIKD